MGRDTMALVRGIAGEAIRALLVLALVFLNFGHASLASDWSAGGYVAAFDTAIPCGPAQPGSPVLDTDPCPACRIASGIDLPPAPSGVVLAQARVATAGHDGGDTVPRRALFTSASGPRAPPTA